MVLALVFHSPVDGAPQRVQSASAARRARHDRDAQLALERGNVDLDALFARLIHQVQAQHGVGTQRERLQHEDQPALETARVRDEDNGVRLARAQEFARQALLRRAGAQGISTRQIDKDDVRPA